MDYKSDTTHNDDTLDADRTADQVPVSADIADELPPPVEHGGASPSPRRFSRPLVAGVLAGVVGLGLGAGAVALIDGHDRDGDRGNGSDSRDDHRQTDRFGRMSGHHAQDGHDGQGDGMGRQPGQMQPGQMHRNPGGS